MAKRNGRGNKNLPAKIPPYQRGLKRGGNPGPHPGAGRPGLAIRLRAQSYSPKALELARSVLEGEELEPRVVDKEIVYTAPTNQAKLAAAELVLKVADDLPRTGVNIEAGGDVTINVVRLPKANRVA